MSKLSKQMAKDFTQSKKKSYIQGSNCTQINELGLKEQFDDGRTVFKISRNRSISPLPSNSSYPVSRKGTLDEKLEDTSPMQSQAEIAHNLSVRFENVLSKQELSKDISSNRGDKQSKKEVSRNKISKTEIDNSYDSKGSVTSKK